MADDGGLSSTDYDSTAARLDPSSNKRKFDDVQVDKETSRTGFSDRIESDAAAGNPPQKSGIYSSVPPPLSDFELAKQKAAQIAARLVGSAPVGAIADGEQAKRARTEDNGADDRGVSNGSRHDRGYGEVERVSKFSDQPVSKLSDQPVSKFSDQPTSLLPIFKPTPDFHQTPYQNPQVGFPETRKMEIPNARVGIVIGKGGDTIKNLQYQSGARIQVTRDADADPTAPTRQVEIMGTLEQVSRAEQLIKDVIAEATNGEFAPSTPRDFWGVPTNEQASIRVPNIKVGLIIGRGGETIRRLQSQSGARIQFALPQDGEQGMLERVVTLTGTKQQTDYASELIKEIIDENRVRGPPGHGGYNQPYYRPPGPPPHWGPPGPRPPYQGYGYRQQGPYSGPQYPPPPPAQQYGGYSQPPPAAYNPGWNQTPPGPPQQPPQQGSYDSYSQPSQTQQAAQSGSTATDGGFGYSQQGYYSGYQQQPTTYQQQAYQQSYSQPQQGFSELSQGYTQPQESYDQSQEGYTQPQAYGQQQEGYNQSVGYNQQSYSSGYDYNQASQGQPTYSQPGYPQQSYGDQSQYAPSSDESSQQPATGGYNHNQSSQSALP